MSRLCVRYRHKDVNNSLLRLLTRPRLMEAASSGYFALRNEDRDLTRPIDKLVFSSSVRREMWHPSYDCFAIVTTQEVLRKSIVVLTGCITRRNVQLGYFSLYSSKISVLSQFFYTTLTIFLWRSQEYHVCRDPLVLQKETGQRMLLIEQKAL